MKKIVMEINIGLGNEENRNDDAMWLHENKIK